MNLTAQLDELMQEDQGSTIRIEELERHCDLLQAAVTHVNHVRQNSTEVYVHAVKKVEEASYAQHLRDEEVAESLYQELGQLRSDASPTIARFEQQVQGDGHNMARRYEKLVAELNAVSYVNV